MKTYNDIKKEMEEISKMKKQIQNDGEELLLAALKEHGGEIELDYEYEETVCINYDGDGHEWEANPYSAVNKIFLTKDGKVGVEFEEDWIGFGALSSDEQINLLEVVFEQTLPRLAKENEE